MVSNIVRLKNASEAVWMVPPLASWLTYSRKDIQGKNNGLSSFIPLQFNKHNTSHLTCTWPFIQCLALLVSIESGMCYSLYFRDSWDLFSYPATQLEAGSSKGREERNEHSIQRVWCYKTQWRRWYRGQRLEKRLRACCVFLVQEVVPHGGRRKHRDECKSAMQQVQEVGEAQRHLNAQTQTLSHSKALRDPKLWMFFKGNTNACRMISFVTMI